jgi:hypothetical protein
MNGAPDVWATRLLYYTNQKGTRTGEFMKLSAIGKVARVVANYSVASGIRSPLIFVMGVRFARMPTSQNRDMRHPGYRCQFYIVLPAHTATRHFGGIAPQ